MKSAEKNKDYNYPFCDRLSYAKRGGLKNHILLKHLGKRVGTIGIILSIIGIILSIIFFIISAVAQSEISYIWDKYILDKNVDFEISVNSVYFFKNDRFLLLDNWNKTMEYMSKQIEFGFIPPWYNGQYPLRTNLSNDLTNENYCAFISWTNLNKPSPHTKKGKILSFTTDINKFPTKFTNCEACLGQLFYGVNSGGRTIDKLKIKVCYDRKYFIVDTDLKKISSNCISIEGDYVIKRDELLGYVILNETKQPVYYDLYDTLFNSVSGEYESKGKTFELNYSSLSQIIMPIIPNCRWSGELMNFGVWSDDELMGFGMSNIKP